MIVCGKILDGVNCVDTISKVTEINDTIIVVVSDTTDLKEVYKWVINNKDYDKLAVIDSTENKDILGLLGLLVSDGNYNIYKAPFDIVDEEYVDTIAHRDCTAVEAKMFLRGLIWKAENMDACISSLIGIVASDEIDKIKELDKNTLLAALNNVKLCKEYYNDYYNDIQSAVASAIENVQKEIGSSEEVTALKDSVNELNSKCEEYKTTISKITKEKSDLVAKINSLGPNMSVVDTVNVASIRCKTSRIMYIKELSYVPYMNTLVQVLAKMANRVVKKVKQTEDMCCKVIICDDKLDYSLEYEGILTVDGTNYIAKRDKVVGLDDKSAHMVVASDNLTAVIEDVLKLDLALVIIYDRLKLSKDIIRGNNVEKYWVINSKNGIDRATIITGGIDKSKIITRPDVELGTIGLAEMAGYRSDTQSAKNKKWFDLGNCNSEHKENPEKILTTLLKSVGITLPNQNRG